MEYEAGIWAGRCLTQAVGHVRYLGLYLMINECHLKVYKEIEIYISLSP